HLLTDPFTSDTSGTPNLPRPWFAHFEHLSDTDVNIYIGTQGRGVWKIKIRLPKPGDNNTTVGVGIGASVAVGLVDDTTTASITGTLVGGADLTINASTQHLLNVSAKTGAAGGDVAVTPAVAIALSNVTTTATVDPNATPLAISGSFTASADQTASAGTSASGDAQGSDAAVGLSLGLTIANHNSTATLERDLTAGGDVTISADGSSDSSANAHASAAGAPGESSGGASGSGVDDQVAQQRGFADTTSTSNGGHGTGGTGTPSASTSDGGVSVAAAVGINLATTTSLATVADNVTIHAGGRFTLATSADTDAQAAADGSAVQPPSDSSGNGSSGASSDGSGGGVSIGASGVTAGSVGIGASVAVALVDDVTRAELIGTLSGGHNVTIAATTSDAMATHAKTGAAGGDVAVVPSVAITLSNVTTLATIGGGADLNITGAFSASTDQSASAGSTAEGDAQGKDAAIGV